MNGRGKFLFLYRLVLCAFVSSIQNECKMFTILVIAVLFICHCRPSHEMMNVPERWCNS